MTELPKLTKTEHRIFQTLLNLPNPVDSETLMLTIINGRRKEIRSKPGDYLGPLRKKLAIMGFLLEVEGRGHARYTLRRLKKPPPLRDRSSYMRKYRNVNGRPSRSIRNCSRSSVSVSGKPSAS